MKRREFLKAVGIGAAATQLGAGGNKANTNAAAIVPYKTD